MATPQTPLVMSSSSSSGSGSGSDAFAPVALDPEPSSGVDISSGAGAGAGADLEGGLGPASASASSSSASASASAMATSPSSSSSAAAAAAAGDLDYDRQPVGWRVWGAALIAPLIAAIVIAAAWGAWAAATGGTLGRADDGDGDGSSSGGVVDKGGPTVVVISLDGFRASYLTEHAAALPHLSGIAARGVSVDGGMKPVFPSKTFPNHYSLVTGLLPAWSGIIANTMWDPSISYTFTISNPTAVRDPRWWKGEPIWITNQKQGGRTGVMFWPGSEAPHDGVLPTEWFPFDPSYPYQQRFEQVMNWIIGGPEEVQEEEMNLALMYIDKIDTDGHQWGPNSPNVVQSLSLIDTLIGNFLEELDQRGIRDDVQLLITGDHGMMQGSQNKVIMLDEILNFTGDVERVVDWSPNAYIIPKGYGTPAATAHEDAILAAVAAAPNIRGFRKEDIPAQYEYRDSDRITPLLLVADDGWQISSRARYERNPSYFDGGYHGLNNSAPEMQTLFLAEGTRFKPGMVLPHLDNIDVYNILCELIGADPAPNNGTRPPEGMILPPTVSGG